MIYSISAANVAPVSDVISLSFRYRYLRRSIRSVSTHVPITIEVSKVQVTAMQHQACHESRTCVWWQSHLQGRERTHSIFPKNCAPSNDVIALSFRYRELRGSVRSVNAHARPEYNNGC